MDWLGICLKYPEQETCYIDFFCSMGNCNFLSLLIFCTFFFHFTFSFSKQSSFFCQYLLVTEIVLSIVSCSKLLLTSFYTWGVWKYRSVAVAFTLCHDFLYFCLRKVTSHHLSSGAFLLQ